MALIIRARASRRCGLSRGNHLSSALVPVLGVWLGKLLMEAVTAGASGTLDSGDRVIVLGTLYALTLIVPDQSETDSGGAVGVNRESGSRRGGSAPDAGWGKLWWTSTVLSTPSFPR